ncbi:hypothetical protein MRX96_006874 [Rhipicephalus microplus]
MESAPRLPMLSCELKSSPSNAEFGPFLKKYIAEYYLEDPDSYNNEIRELEALRMAAIKVSRDFTGCSVLKRYYSQLLCLQSRFPMTDEGAACVPFMWTDIYSGMVFNIMDIKYEQASILYNIGALHSKLGALENRTSSEGMKIACTHFQCAAWALSQVKDLFPPAQGQRHVPRPLAVLCEHFPGPGPGMYFGKVNVGPSQVFHHCQSGHTSG